MTSSGTLRAGRPDPPPVRILCVTDPSTHKPFDTTVALYRLLPADPRFALWHLAVRDLGDGSGFRVVRVDRPLSFEEFLQLDRFPTVPGQFSDFDLAYHRADKPHPPGYLETLARFEAEVRFVVRPSLALAYANRVFTRSVAGEFMAPGVMTRHPAEAAAFIARHRHVVAKTNRSSGGQGVFRIQWEAGGWTLSAGDGAPRSFQVLEALVAELVGLDPEPFELVKYLRGPVLGDKRVIVMSGEVWGAFLRVAPEDRWVHNLSVGGRALPAEVSPHEREVIAATWPRFHAVGLEELGYDFLMNPEGVWTLSEINGSGNLGGHPAVEQTSGVAVFPRLLDWLHQRARA